MSVVLAVLNIILLCSLYTHFETLTDSIGSPFKAYLISICALVALNVDTNGLVGQPHSDDSDSEHED